MSGQKEYWENLVSGEELAKARRQRSKKTELMRIRESQLASYSNKGWKTTRTFKNGDLRVERSIPIDRDFENRVWLMFCSMGYTQMNRDNNFVVRYGKSDPGLTKQLDVFAMDDETIIIVECKAAKTPGKHKDFLKDIGEFREKMEGIRNSIHQHFGTKRRVKFIWATHNYVLGDQDKARLKEADMVHFRTEDIEYYTELAKHLGQSAKYQLLGRLFRNQKVPNMPTTVPAIRGKMGKHTYYSFSIEPERLLKIGYVLHRSDANYNLMPTYQRVIKKARLKGVREFVENGGFFPNSIVISIDTKKLKFDTPSNTYKKTDSDATLGILHLPQKYCSAYIIDGQHRLYGYTGTKYASTNTIPVVAFLNLTREEQVKIFMEINQNQKAVPLNLRNTLSATLLYDSDDPNECRTGLRSRIAQRLGEDPDSPLRDRVVIGENKRTSTRCITMETINKGLKDRHLLSTFDKGGRVEKIGLLDSSDVKNDYAYNKLVPFLYESFDYIKEQLPEEWDKGNANEGLLTNNTGIYALLCCFSDILEYLFKNNSIDTKNASTSQLIDACSPYYETLIDFYRFMDDEMVTRLHDNYGGNGSRDHWRFMQKALHEKWPSFKPEGLESWWDNNSKARNAPALERLDAINDKVHEITKSGLQEIYGSGWEDNLPESLLSKCGAAVAKSKRERSKDPTLPVKTNWDFITLSDCRSIALDATNWSEFFKTKLTRPNQPRAKKADVTRWIDEFDKMRNDLKGGKGRSISAAEFNDICSVIEWLCPDADFNDSELAVSEG